MKKVYVALLAAVFAFTAAASVTITAAQHPASGPVGLLAAAAAPAAADDDDQGNGKHHRHHRRGGNVNCGGYTNQYGQWTPNTNCGNGNGYGNCGRRGDQDKDDRGRPGNCGYDGNSGYYGNGGYGNGGYGNGGYGGSGRNGGAQVSGVITAVNGNQVRVQQGFTNSILINDQPALDRQQTGRVAIGRSITAYGYWQNGTFYATSIV
ncbi:MAG: hypothetical protein ACXWNJ_05455 [Vulcanimicrobiaceae bacterium]